MTEETMKIYVDKIDETGIGLSEQIEPNSLSLDTESLAFVKPISVKARAVKKAQEVFIEILVEVPVEYTCAKCLSRFESVFKKEFNMFREARPGDIIELDDDIRQEIMLDYPMKVTCKPDCKGLCPNCGQNLNTGECDCE
jgi:uncharacterized protein